MRKGLGWIAEEVLGFVTIGRGKKEEVGKMERSKCGLGLVMLGVVVFLFSQPVSAAIEGQGVWLFDENDGAVAYDSSINNNTGSISGATWIDGKFNYALDFDGDNRKVTVPSSESLEATVTAITVEAWIYSKGTTAAWSKFIVKEGSYDIYWNNATTLSANLPGTGAQAALSSPSVPSNVWCHFTMTYGPRDATYHTWRMWIGTNYNEYVWKTGNLATNSNSLIIGDDDGVPTRYTQGYMDEVRILDRVLTNDEIAYDSENSIIPEASSLMYIGLSLPWVFLYLRKRLG